MLGSGAVVVIGDRTNLLAAATNVLRFFRQRVVRQVRAVPRRLAQGPPHPDRRARARRRRGRDRRPHRPARGDAAADLDLRARPGGARPGDERAAPAAHAHRLAADRLMADDRAGILHGQDRVRGVDAASARRTSPGPRPCCWTSACGRVPAADVRAPGALPGFDRSSVDGYAVRAADTFGASESIPGYLRVVGAVRMGAAASTQVGPGTAVAIPTGGMLPGGADAVVMIEHTAEATADTVEVARPVAPGENVVRFDEDVAAGAAIAPRGARCARRTWRCSRRPGWSRFRYMPRRA